VKSTKVNVNSASIDLIHGDSLEVLNPSCPTIERGSIDCVVTSPPYNLGIKYRSHDDSAPRDVYLSWTKQWLEAVRWVMSEHGSLFLNIGGKPTDPLVPFQVTMIATQVFTLQNTISWVKALSVDDGPVRGHVKPINSPRFVNGSWELVLHLTKTGEVELDRTAPGLGVEFADKSNLTRGTRGKNGDRRCRGDVWAIPYDTIKSRKDDRPHPATFPPRLAEMCFLLHGVSRIKRTLDPFSGLGSTARASAKLGLDHVGVEIDEIDWKESIERVRKAGPTKETVGPPR
jgi:site-specific DNA-methyltransferase (adenine-specific)